MSCVSGTLLQCHPDYPLDIFVADLPGCSAARLIQKRIDSTVDESLAPTADRVSSNAEVTRDLSAWLAICSSKHDTRSLRQRLCGLSATGPSLERFSILVAQNDLRCRESLLCHVVLLHTIRRSGPFKCATKLATQDTS